MNTLEEFIIGQSGNTWPRGMGNPYRGSGQFSYIANSYSDVLRFMRANNYTDVYMTVYSFTHYSNPKTDGKNAIIDCIPFDFDAEDLNIALEDLKFVVRWCIRHDIQPRITFSGGKGFHLIIDFPPIDLKNPKETIRRFVKSVIDGGQLTTVDRVVAGDLNRLIRLVGSKHSSTNLFCTPLSPGEALDLTLDDILELAKAQRKQFCVFKHYAPALVTDVLLEIDEQVTTEVNRPSLKKSVLSNIFCSEHVKSSTRKCLAFEDIRENGINSGTRDEALVGCIHFLREAGHPISEVRRICLDINKRFSPPFSTAYVNYKVGYHMDVQYSPCTFFSKFSSCCQRCARGRRFE